MRTWVKQDWEKVIQLELKANDENRFWKCLMLEGSRCADAVCSTI